nr:MAG: replication polyprotein [Owegonang virus 16]
MWNVTPLLSLSWAGYVVFDDIPWDYVKMSAKMFFGGQSNFTVTDKYVKKAILTGGWPLIVCINEDFYCDGYKDFAQSDWGRENITVVRLMNKLY